MKERVSISFSGYGHPQSHLYERLQGWGVDESSVHYQYQNYRIDLEGGDQRIDRVLGGLRTMGIDPGIRRDIAYSKQELKAAALLWLCVTTPERGNPQVLSTFDRTTGCPRCGTGSTQVGPLRIAADDLPKRVLVAQTYTGEILVADQLAR